MDKKKENIPPSGPSQSTRAKPSTAHTPRPYPHHVRMPFNYGATGIAPKGEDLQLLRNIFPGTVSILFGPGWMSFKLQTLPPGPYPLTVAGALCLVHDTADPPNGVRFPFPRGQHGTINVTLLPDVDGVHMEHTSSALRGLFDSISSALHEYIPELTLRNLRINLGKTLTVVVADTVNLTAIRLRKPLPSKIAKFWTEYLNEKDLPRPHQNLAGPVRSTQPDLKDGIVDREPYEVLRPGVLACSPAASADDNLDLFTTTGALVKDRQDNYFMTAASHGIGPSETLYQPLPLGGRRVIGNAVLEISFTDIALVKLAGRDFSNNPFEDPEERYITESSTELLLPPALTGLWSEHEGDQIGYDTEPNLYMNNPFTGFQRGVYIFTEAIFQTLPDSHPVEKQLDYTMMSWGSFGQGSELPDSICGSPVWNDKGRVLGFFRYAFTEGQYKGYAGFPCADELVKAGYTLA